MTPGECQRPPRGVGTPVKEPSERLDCRARCARTNVDAEIESSAAGLRGTHCPPPSGLTKPFLGRKARVGAWRGCRGCTDRGRPTTEGRQPSLPIHPGRVLVRRSRLPTLELRHPRPHPRRDSRRSSGHAPRSRGCRAASGTSLLCRGHAPRDAMPRLRVRRLSLPSPRIRTSRRMRVRGRWRPGTRRGRRQRCEDSDDEVSRACPRLPTCCRASLCGSISAVLRRYSA